MRRAYKIARAGHRARVWIADDAGGEAMVSIDGRDPAATTVTYRDTPTERRDDTLIAEIAHAALTDDAYGRPFAASPL